LAVEAIKEVHLYDDFLLLICHQGFNLLGLLDNLYISFSLSSGREDEGHSMIQCLCVGVDEQKIILDLSRIQAKCVEAVTLFEVDAEKKRTYPRRFRVAFKQ